MINKKLVVILSPDSFDRNTEIHFKSLFKEVEYVWPPRFQISGEENPQITKDCILLFEGGTDISSELYGEARGHWTQEPDVARDVWEQKYFNMAKACGAGMIGVCRGAQLLCALNGGHIIQHVKGHNCGRHVMIAKAGPTAEEMAIYTTSVHHQMMNPYVLPKEDWASLAWMKTPLSNKYRGQEDKKIKISNLYKDWREQEIVWFPKTHCLCIQGHPEYYANDTSMFVYFCRLLILLYLSA